VSDPVVDEILRYLFPPNGALAWSTTKLLFDADEARRREPPPSPLSWFKPCPLRPGDLMPRPIYWWFTPEAPRQ